MKNKANKAAPGIWNFEQSIYLCIQQSKLNASEKKGAVMKNKAFVCTGGACDTWKWKKWLKEMNLKNY